MSNPINQGNIYKNTIQDGVLQNDPQSESVQAFREQHPELYGRLLIANERLENVGAMMIWLVLIWIIGVCVAIHMAWVDPLLGIPIERLQHWGVYILIIVVSFVAYTIYYEFFEKIAYKKMRPSISNYLSQQGLSIPWLVTQLEGDESLSEINDRLKKDTDSDF